MMMMMTRVTMVMVMVVSMMLSMMVLEGMDDGEVDDVTRF
jgi:hypothetical protein